MANTKFTGFSESYIFDDAGNKRDQLEQTILTELQSKKYPLKSTISTIKASGGGLFGALGASKEQCVVIQIDSESQIAISNTSVGTYLYVEIYLMIQEKSGLFAGLSAMMDNAFKQQKRNAYFAAAKSATESAFNVMQLKQINSGYKSSSRTITSDN
jgi:hypothetical protein